MRARDAAVDEQVRDGPAAREPERAPDRGTIAFAFLMNAINPDYAHRPEPADMLRSSAAQAA